MRRHPGGRGRNGRGASQPRAGSARQRGDSGPLSRHQLVGQGIRMRAGLAVVLVAGSALAGQGAEYLDLAAFGKPLQDASSIGIQWDEERDLRQVWVRFSGDVPSNAAVEYWFKNWPYDPPKMPTIEDPVDYPWQGKWLRAKTVEHCSSGECTYDMAPLDEAENPRAKNLPGVRYRRTLKIRLVTTSKVSALRVFSDSTEAPLQIQVE